MVNRTVSGAHYGVRDWLLQRISALIMLAFMLFMLFYLLTHQPLHYADWRGLFQVPAMRIFTLLFACSLFAHAWIGVRDILMDYVRATWLRLSLHTASLIALLVYGFWTVALLWGQP